MYKIRGKIKSVEAVNLNTQKGDFVKKLITIEELDTGFNHIQQFEIFGQESIDAIEGGQKLAEELIVSINFYIRSNEFKGRFYNTLMVKELRVENTYVKRNQRATILIIVPVFFNMGIFLYLTIMKKTYFIHESSSFNDYKIIKLRSKLGIEAYGIFWAVLELLFNEENKLCIDDYDALAFSLQCDPDKLKQVIEDFDLFVVEDGCFYSKRLNNHLEDINTKSNKAKENANKRWKNATAMQTQCNGNASISISNSISSSKSISKNKITNRIHEFKNSVLSHKDFNNDDLENFFSYWSELNKSGSKMRWELERTWNLNLRLKRWVNNGFNKNKNKMPDYFDDVLYKKMDISAKKEYENHLKLLGYSYAYNPNSGGKWIKK